MTTISLDATASRSSYHRHWSVSGSTWPTGKNSSDVEILHFLFAGNGSLLAANYTGDEFGYLHGDDDAGTYRYRGRAVDDDGTHSWDDDYTHTPPTYAHNIYVDPAAVDDTAAGTQLDPYKTAAAGAAALKALGSGAANRKLWLHTTGTHAVSSSLAASDTDGLFAIGAWGGGAQATIDLGANVTLLSGIGPHDATGQYATDVRDIAINGDGGTTAAVFEFWVDGNNGSALSHSCSFKNIDIDNVYIGFRMASGNGGHDTTDITNGLADFLAYEDVHLSNLVSYGWFGQTMRKLLRKNISYTVGTNGGTGTATRWYGASLAFRDMESISECAADSQRWLSADAAGIHQTHDHNACRISVWKGATGGGLYVEHNVASEGGDDPATNTFTRLKYHSVYAAANVLEFGGDRSQIMVRAGMFRNSQVTALAESGTNNDRVVDFRVQCCSWYRSGAGGGDSWGPSITTANAGTSGYHISHHAGYVTGSGNIEWAQTDTASSDPAMIAYSDYNVVLSNGPTTRWYRLFDPGGGGTLAAWTDPTTGNGQGHDANSDDVGTTHGFDTLGTAGTNDWDLHLSAAASSFKDAGGATLPFACRVDYDHHERVATHDVGADDFAATEAPDAPSVGGGGDPNASGDGLAGYT